MKTSQNRGFTITEVLIVLAILLLLGCIAIPNFIQARTDIHRNKCVANLKTINQLKLAWYNELDNFRVRPDLVMPNFMITNIACPSKGMYTIGAHGVKPTCSLADKGHLL